MLIEQNFVPWKKRDDKTKRPTYHQYFMEMAQLAATRSTCLRREVGAVAVIDNHVLCSGYNGSPRGLPHCKNLGCMREEMRIPSGERHELCRAVHAEQNLICQAAYHGVSLRGATIYCTNQPCSICAKLLVNVGIEKVIYKDGYPDKATENILMNRLIKVKEAEND